MTVVPLLIESIQLLTIGQVASTMFVKIFAQVEAVRPFSENSPKGCFITRFYIEGADLDKQVRDRITREISKLSIWEAFEIVSYDIYEVSFFRFISNFFRKGASFYAE